MPSALDVANFFIDIASADTDDDMTNLKVNKLVYYAQGWSKVLLGATLFSEPVETWEHGPVVRSVYNEFKKYGKQRIEKPSVEYNADVFSREQQMFLIDIFLEYDQYTGSALRDMTHKPGTPWSTVYAPGMSNVITDNALFEYFSKQSPLPRFDIRKATANIPTVGCRNTDGYLVLPAELDDKVLQ